MRYIGGKMRQGKMIAKFVVPNLKGAKGYIEPFCGAMGSALAVAKELSDDPVKVYLSDSNFGLINMWQKLMDGSFNPPDFISEEQYCKLKADKTNVFDPLVTYAGFGVSFAGKYYGGYARDNNPRNNNHHNHSLNCKKLTQRKIDALQNLQHPVQITCCSYDYYAKHQGFVFYLDPPYAGRTKQSKFDFNHDDFWEFARNLSKNNIVFVSEFVAPGDFVVVHSWGDTVVRHFTASTKGDGTKECLYVHESITDRIRIPV